MSEDHVALLSSSIEELLSPIPGVIEKSPAGNKVLNISSIVELLNQTGSLEKFLEVHQSLNSNSISLAKLLNTRAYASSDHRDASIVSRVVVSTDPA